MSGRYGNIVYMIFYVKYLKIKEAKYEEVQNEIL